MGGSERAGEPDRRILVIAGAYKIDGAMTVNLSDRKKKDIDAALPRAIEQLARTIGEKIVLPALKQRDIRTASAAFACKQCCRCRNRRSVTDSHVPDVSDQACDDVG